MLKHPLVLMIELKKGRIKYYIRCNKGLQIRALDSIFAKKVKNWEYIDIFN